MLRKVKIAAALLIFIAFFGSVVCGVVAAVACAINDVGPPELQLAGEVVIFVAGIVTGLFAVAWAACTVGDEL